MKRKKSRVKAKKKYRYANPVNGKPVSRQRIWQLRNRSKGRCIICGKKSESYRCEECNDAHLERQKK